MKVVKNLFALSAIAGLAMTLSARAQVADGTYTFESTDGNTSLDGSSVTFSGDSIVGWDLLDPTAITQGYPASYDPFLPPLTTGNSSLFDFGTLGAASFYFEVASPTGSTETSGSIFYFEGEDNVDNSSALYDGFGGGSPDSTITIEPTINDPVGVWNFVAPDDRDVPDAVGTFQLLAGSMTALGICRSLLRRSPRA